MAYKPKYHIGWRGDRRERLEYDIQILERDYTGSVTEAYLMGDGVVLTYGKQDDDELVPFKPSTATLSLFCNNEQADFSDLYTSDPLKYQVTITEVRNFLGVLRWRGYISTGRYARPWGRTPFKVTIEANDGMEALMNIPYQVDSTTRHTDTLTIRGLLERLVEPLGVWQVNMSNIPKISPSQTEDSADVIGIAANAIYEAFNNEVPSHYDLLIAVLRHFGLQAYFEAAKLCVRSVLGLASLSRPDWAGSLESSFGQTPLTFVPLESTMSVEAELSMLPPVRSLEMERVEGEGVIHSMLNPKMWIASWQTIAHLPGGYAGVSKQRDGIQLTVISDRQVDTYNRALLKYPFDARLSRSLGMSINIDIDLYAFSFDSVVDQSFHVGETATMSAVFALIPEGEYSDSIFSLSGDNGVNIPDGSYIWNAAKESVASEFERWEKQTARVEGLSTLLKWGWQIALNPQRMAAATAQRLASELLVGTKASFTIDGIAGESGIRYRMVMLIGATSPKNSFRARLVNPTLSVSITDFADMDEVTIGLQGSESLSYKQGFVDDKGLGILIPSVVDVNSASSISRYVNTSQSTQMIRVLGAKLRDMRRAVTRQLDGEVSVARPLSLNTLWSDKSGNAYYTNYIRMMLKRGVSEVQLRELIPLRAKSVWTINTSMANARYVSNDSTALAYIPSDSTGIYLLIPSSRNYLKLERALTISKGVDSMIAVRVNADNSADFSLTAYADGGVILSELASLYDIMVAFWGDSLRPTPTTSMASAARYDATTGMWVIPEFSGSRGYIYLADATGRAIAMHTINGEGTIRRVVVISGGFVVVDYISATNIKTTSYYYNLYGELESYTDICSASEELVDLNDVYAVLYQGRTRMALREIKSTRSEMLKGEDPLWSFETSALTYVDMNCALVLFRNALGEAVVFDGRTGRRVVVSDGTQGTLQKYMLIGECVYAPDGLNMYETRILEGM